MEPFDVDAPIDDWEFPPSAPDVEDEDPAPMYEPESQPGDEYAAPSPQWDAYDNTQAIPPRDDFAPEPPGVSGPPPGRQYGMYRQQPTWQHASLEGVPENMTVNMGGLLQGLAAIAGSAGLGYLLTGSWKVAAGGGLGMAGLLQLPTIFSGSWLRPFLGIAAIGGAYFILRDDLEGLAALMDEDEDEAWQPNDDGDDDGDDDDDDDDDFPSEVRRDDPSKSSPWLKPETD